MGPKKEMGLRLEYYISACSYLRPVLPDMSEEKESIEIDKRRLLRKIDLHLLPALSLLLLLSFLDQGNSELLPCFTALPSTHLVSVRNACIKGLLLDTHMSACSPKLPYYVSTPLITAQTSQKPVPYCVVGPLHYGYPVWDPV